MIINWICYLNTFKETGNELKYEKCCEKINFIRTRTSFLATTFSSNPPPGWYQQTLPIGDGISDMFFLNNFTGWQITNTGFIVKTTNGGDSWNIQIDSAGNLYGIQFLDLFTGYCIGNGTHGILYKTTNGGINWSLIHDFSPAGIFRDMNFVNKDTGWVCSIDPFDGGVFKTTNGGQSWIRQLDLSLSNPQKILFVNRDTGWIGNADGQLYKTLNGGTKWSVQHSFDGAIKEIFFVNPDSGWISIASVDMVQFTSNGGNNWITQTLPPKGEIIPNGGIIVTSRAEGFSSLDGATVWCVGGGAFYGMGRFRGIIFKSTNSGSNWYYQIPDTSIAIATYKDIQFVTDSIGWASFNGLIHTTDGGGPLVKIKNIMSEIPGSFVLHQNYPNPFNPKTVIPYQLTASNFLIIKVYDALGNEIETLINANQNAGEYNVEFDGTGLSSGVYFYKLEIIDERSNQVFGDAKKMLLLK